MGLAPFRETPAAVHGRGGDHDRHLVGIHFLQQFLQGLNLLQRALGPAGHGVGEETHVLQPHHALAAEHRYGLHGIAEAVDGCLNLVDVAGEATDDLAGEIVGLRRGRQLLEALLAQAADEEVIGTADEDEGLGGDGHHSGFARETRETHEDFFRSLPPSLPCHREAGLAAVAIQILILDCFIAALLAMTVRA